MSLKDNRNDFTIKRIEMARNFAKSLNYEEIDKIILFGSVARGEDNEDSDIDILILTTDKDKIEKDVYSKVTDFLLNTWEAISVKIIPLDHYNNYKSIPFFTNVFKEGILIG
jgi:predicted nucleotidyltransferase